jgi:hypothetical protein
MKLIAAELKTTLIQEVTTDRHRKQIVVVRPHLLRFGAPAGTVKVQILNGSGTLVAESGWRNITDIGSGTYWHGYARFDVSAHLAKDTLYKIAVVASGYAFSETAYLAWCSGFDLGKYTAEYSESRGFLAPLDLEIWTRQQIKKGVA